MTMTVFAKIKKNLAEVATIYSHCDKRQRDNV